MRLKLHIQSLHLDKSRVYQKQDKGQYVYALYILLCWSVYFSILTIFCLKLYENCNSFHFSHTICYTSGCSVLNFMYTASPSLYAGSALWHIFSFSTAAVILAQLLTSSSIKSQDLSSLSSLFLICISQKEEKEVAHTNEFRNLFPGFTFRGDLILSKFKNQFFACSVQLGQEW